MTGNDNTAIGHGARVANLVNHATAIGAGALAEISNSVVIGTDSDTVLVPGKLFIGQLGPLAGTTHLCLSGNTFGSISACSSSLRYKDNIKPFGFGLNLVNQLKPITFDWKNGGMKDLGLGAEEVAAVEPLLVTYKNGQVEGVKYDRIGVVLVNAVKEQQAQIDDLKKQIEILKAVLCQANPSAAVCQEEK